MNGPMPPDAVSDRMRSGIAAVADELVVAPVAAELQRLRDAREALATAAKAR